MSPPLRPLPGLAAAFLAFTLSARASLIAYWPFSEGTGTTVGDASGNGRTGTLGSAGTGTLPQWDTVNGRFGNAMNFVTPNTTAGSSANGSLVTVPFHASLQLNGAFTVSLWWRPDSDFTSGFPGAIRIGSQSATTGTNIGWGFFHGSTELPVFKRGNVQPGMLSPAVPMTIGQWTHLLLSYDGAGNNIAVQNGVSRLFTTTWLAATTTAALELGRMDQFGNAGLDDIALFNHALTEGEGRSLYTAPTNLGLAYSLAEMAQLWQIHAGGPGSQGLVGGQTWMFTNALPGTPATGDAYSSGGAPYIALTATTGVTLVPEPASAAFLGLGLAALAAFRRRR